MSYDASVATNFFKQHKKILIVTHINPDGDAIGSMTALALVAKAQGSTVRLMCQSPVPDNLAWVPLPEKMVHSIAELSGWVPDLLVTVDCGDPHRAGKDVEAFFNGAKFPGWDTVKSLNIDHHRDNPEAATVNWVEPTAGATAELVGLLAEHCGLPLTGELGEAVYLGLVSDTGNFTFSSATASVIDMAARIVAQGLRVEEFTQKHENNWSLGRMHLWGELFSNINSHLGGQVVSIVISSEQLKKHGANASDLEGFVSFLRRLKGVKVSLLAREKPSVGCKMSLRSMGGEGSVDVQAISARFGGGGHRSASGIEFALPPEEAVKRVLEALTEVL